MLLETEVRRVIGLVDGVGQLLSALADGQGVNGEFVLIVVKGQVNLKRSVSAD
jgi:hypothetical protein